MEGTVQRVRVGDVLRLVRRPISVDPFQTYTQIGVRSFGKGIFHYDPVTGAELGKLRFFEIHPDELVVSNIKGWEGAIAVSSEEDDGCIGSNRFLTYQPRDGRVDIRYLKYFFLSQSGLELIHRASPGSTDRNLTLGIKAFELIEVPLPPVEEQRHIARQLDRLITRLSVLRRRQQRLLNALEPSLLNNAFAGIT